MSWQTDLKNFAVKVGKPFGLASAATDAAGLTSSSAPTTAPLDTSVLTPGIEQANAAYQAALEQQQRADNLQLRAMGITGAPEIQDRQIVGIPQISANTGSFIGQGQIERAQAPTINQTRDVQMGPVDTTINTGRGPAADVARLQNVDSIERAKAAQIGPTATAQSAGVQGTTIDPAANELRGQRLAFGQQMLKAPSVAEAEYRAGLAQASSEALGAAAQSRGADRAGARRAAALALSQGGIQGSAQLAAARAGEEVAKQKGFADTLGSVQGSDVNLATKQAELSQSRNSLDAQLKTAVAQGNRDAINAIQMQQAQLDTEINRTNAQAENTRQIQNANAFNSASQFNAGQTNLMESQKYTTEAEAARASMQARLDLAKSQAQVAGDTANRMTTADTNNAQIQAEMARANAAAENTRSAANATGMTAQMQADAIARNEANARNQDVILRTAAANQGNTTAVQTQNAQNDAKAEMDRITAEREAVAAHAQGIAAQQGAAGLNIEAGRSVMDAQAAIDRTKAEAEQANKDRNTKFWTTAGSAALTYSDMRVKKDIKQIPDEDILDLAEKMKTYTYRYKPGMVDNDDGEMQIGTMAQDLEKSKLGKLFVKENPDGVKEVNYPVMASLFAAQAVRAQKGSRRG